MPEVKGLEGLKGLSFYSLTRDEQNQYIKQHPALRNYSIDDVATIYKNENFIAKFGRDKFNEVQDWQQRDEMFRNAIIGETL